jgi:outer membrane immunogenic protein
MLHRRHLKSVGAGKGGRAMRRVVIGCGLILGLIHTAVAADLDDALRGSSTPVYHWGGLYGGAQIGYASSGVDFGNGVSSLIAFALRNTRVNNDLNVSDLTVLGKRDVSGTGFGGFIGYNFEYEDTVLGVELNYNRMHLGATAQDGLGRVFTDAAVAPNYNYDVVVIGQSSIHITDLATLRARGGWEIDRFMPYGFVGFAFGRADVASTATVAFCGSDTLDPAPVPANDPAGCTGPVPQAPQTQAKTGEFIFGGAVGVGVDMALLPNVFVRGEWEYLQLAPVQGMHVYVNSFRTGLGMLF